MTTTTARIYSFKMNRYVHGNKGGVFPLVGDDYLIDINGEIFFDYDERYHSLLDELFSRVNPFVRTTSGNRQS